MKAKLMILVFCVFVGWLGAVAQTKYDKGQTFFDQKKYPEAIAEFHALIAESPKDEQAWFLLSKTFLQIQQYDSAEIAGKHAIELDDDLLDAYVVTSEAQISLKKGNEALQTVNAGIARLKKKTEYAPLYLQLGKADLMTGKNDDALIAFTKYGELVPTDYRAFEGKGDVYAKQNITEMSIIQYEKALELDSTQIAVIYKLANTYAADRQYTEAGRVYNKVLILQPDNNDARLDLANLYYRAKLWRPCALTLKDYFAKIANPPKNIQVMYLEAMYRSHFYKDALSLAETFLKADPNHAIALRTVAHAYAEQKEYKKSIDAFMKIGKVDTLQSEDYRLMGLVYRQMKNDTSAAWAYIQSLKLDSTQAVLYGEVGSIYMNQRNWELATYYLERRVKIDSGAVAAYINLALCLMQMEEYDKAIENLQKGISINPDYAPAYINVGFCYTGKKEFVESRQWFEKAIKVIDTAETKYRIQLADANKMIGLSYLVDKKDPDHPDKKWENGVLYLERALKFKEDDPNTHVWLAQSYQNLQKKEEAIKHYKRALKLDPKNKEAQKGLEILDPQ